MVYYCWNNKVDWMMYVLSFAYSRIVQYENCYMFLNIQYFFDTVCCTNLDMKLCNLLYI